MKKLLLIAMLIGAMPLSMVAQDDDLYFVPKKSAEKVVDNIQSDVTYSGSDRDVDEYNRRLQSSYQVIDGDTTKSDIIAFSEEKGVYPDSLSEDYKLTKKMSRFEDYELADNAAFWAGYRAGIDTWAWHSPWYYSRFGWYTTWYDPWYDPWYYGYAGYYGYYHGWYYPWYNSWGYPYHHYYYIVGGIGRHYAHIGTGTIRRNGSTHGYYHGGGVASSSRRVSSLRDRADRMSHGSGLYTNRSGNRVRSGSGNFSGYRGDSNRGNSGYSGSRSSYSGSFGGSRSSGGFGSGGSTRSSGGGFSGGSRGGGGGGSRMGGRR